MYLWTRKTPLNFERDPDQDSGFGLDPPWRMSGLYEYSFCYISSTRRTCVISLCFMFCISVIFLYFVHSVKLTIKWPSGLSVANIDLILFDSASSFPQSDRRTSVA